jgi:hypothetical protein
MKSLSERELMQGHSKSMFMLPSMMTKDELKWAIANLTDEERYRFEERLGMLCGMAAPDGPQLDIGWACVLELRWDTKNQTNKTK